MKHMDGKIALVTGASRGLGFAAAQAMGAAGAQVIALARTVGGLEDLDDAIRSAGGPSPVLVPQDLTKDKDLEQLAPALAERVPRLDLWLHTAHWSPPITPVAHLDIRDLNKAWSVNVRPVAALIRALEPLLRLAESPQAVFCADLNSAGKMHHGTIEASHAARDALIADWRRAQTKTGLAVIRACLPPMKTASRARLYPGEPADSLADPHAVAANLIAAIQSAGPDAADLSIA